MSLYLQKYFAAAESKGLDLLFFFTHLLRLFNNYEFVVQQNLDQDTFECIKKMEKLLASK